jgi:Tol biopolymer transport system component
MTDAMNPRPPRRAGSTVVALLSAAAIAMVSAGMVMKLSGCAGRSPAEADNREVRLTSDENLKVSPCYSPDNAWIAYGARDGAKPGSFATYLVSPAGGEPRKISPDSVAMFPLQWAADGKAVICREAENTNLHLVGLDGSARMLRKGEPLTRILAVSPDGELELIARFNGDNRDVGIRKAGGKIEFLAETPAWEEDAVFGPGPGEVTVLSMPSYQAAVSTISTWSPATRAYSPLPLPEGKKYEPAWSLDGKRLAYTAETGGQWDIWTYDPGTTQAKQLVEDPEDSMYPTWSSDGEWLAFIRTSKTSHLFSGPPGASDRRQLTDGPGRDYAPVGSPDGQWIAFLRKPPGGSGQPGTPVLCVMPAGGGEVKELDLKGVALPGSSGEMMSWSRDSRFITFYGSDGSAKMDIYRIGRGGEDLARVTVEPGEELEPRWSPDGRYIAYTLAGAGRLAVAIVPAHGGLPRIVTPEGTKSEGSVWSPGSDRLAHVSYTAKGGFEIWVTPIAAPEQRKRVYVGEGLTWPMFWTEDGEELVLLTNRDRRWSVLALPATGGAAREVGRVTYLTSGKDMVYEFSSGAEKYQRLFYPAGIVLTDGQDRSDLFAIRVREALGTRTASSLTQWLPWRGHIAWAGYF